MSRDPQRCGTSMRHRHLVVLLSFLARLLVALSAVSAKQSALHSNMSLAYPTPIVFNPPSGTHKSTLIFLHGLGDTGAIHSIKTCCEFDPVRRLCHTSTGHVASASSVMCLMQGQAGQMWGNSTLRSACATQSLCFPQLHRQDATPVLLMLRMLIPHHSSMSYHACITRHLWENNQ